MLTYNKQFKYLNKIIIHSDKIKLFLIQYFQITRVISTDNSTTASQMSINQKEEFVKIYKTLAQTPDLVGARLLINEQTLQSVWSQRNLEKGKSSKFFKTHFFINGGENITESIPVDISTEICSSISSSEQHRAVIRDVETKDGNNQFLEIWQRSNLQRSVDLTAYNLHGSVYADVEFGALEWSPDETKILYVAEKKVPKKKPVNKRTPAGDNGNTKEDNVYKFDEYRQDWGEQLVGKVYTVLVVYDIFKDEFTVLDGIPKNICVAKPVWSPTGDYLVGVAYELEPRKLGLIFCTNRPSSIFSLDLNGNYYQMNLGNKSVKSPIFTSDGKSLIWLHRTVGGTHHACMELIQCLLPLAENQFKVKVPVVENCREITNGNFYGLFNTSFPSRCWTNDGRLVLSTAQKNTINSYVVNLENGTLTELNFNDGSLSVLDVYNDNIIVARRNFLQQDTLAVGKLPGVGKEKEITWNVLTEPLTYLTNKSNLKIIYMDLKHPSADPISTFTAIYVGPQAAGDVKVPLIVCPHGGPQGSYPNRFLLQHAIFLSMGYAVLFVNYRGSTGAGQATIDFLSGSLEKSSNVKFQIGTADVADCVLATNSALSQFPWLDKNRVGLVGGSHGGFLVTHLSGQFPDMFKVVVARNPVTDIASKYMASDIPDWGFSLCNLKFSQVGKENEQFLEAARKCSPMVHAHNVKAPTLLHIGTKDLRVPPFQGIEWYHILKANKVNVAMNLYEDNHSLSSVPNEMTEIVATMMWLNEHLV